MDVKSILLKLIFHNQYIVDWLIRRDNDQNNSEMQKWKRRFSCIDSITKFNEFQTAVSEYLSDPDHPQYEMCEGKESLLYGHIQMLYEYAGIPFKTPIYLSKIEHGINFYESKNVFVNDRMPASYIFQGEYKFEFADEMNINVPVYAIGPYIHYAKPYFDENTFRRIKSKWKKTLLVFPAHTYELSKCEYDAERFVESIYSRFESSFDTVLVCSYWLDLDNLVNRCFQKKGAVIVSAGARFDPYFIRRLKTIIQLSDEVVVNDIGTNIGYAMYLGKPVTMLPVYAAKTDSVDSDELVIYKRNEEEFITAFGDENYQKIGELYTRFWGGTECIKTPKQIRDIIKKSERRVKICLGNAELYRFIR